MKALYVCNEYPPLRHGGIGTFVQTIAHGMIAAGHEATVVGWGPDPGERDDAGVRVVTLPESRLRGLAWWLNRRRLWRWIKAAAAAGEVEIVEAPEFQGPLIFRFDNVPCVIRLHLSDTAIAQHAGRKSKGLTRFCERRTLALFGGWISVSHFALDLTINTFGFGPKKSATIYCPIAAADKSVSALPDLPEKFVLYAGGAVSRRKGAYVLAEAAREFLACDPELHLVFIGPLETEEGISAEQRIRSILGGEFEERLHFPGRLSRDVLLACMSRAAVFAYPSTLETFGLVTAEAMLQGCPVVVCDSGPCPEFVEHERSGLLVPPGDSHGFAVAIGRLLKDKVLARRLADSAQEIIRSRFSLSRCVADTVSFYEKAIKEEK